MLYRTGNIPAVPPMFILFQNALSHVLSYMFQDNGRKPSPLRQRILISVCPHKSIRLD